MDVLLEGAIDENTNMTEIMRAVLEQCSEMESILRITSSPLAVNGKIAVMRGGYIVGAKESSGDERYPAIRKLLGVKNGSYAVLVPTDDEFNRINQKVFVKIDRVLQYVERIDTITDGIFESWSKVDKEADIATAQILEPPKEVVMNAYVHKGPRRQQRFNKFLTWERQSEKFVGAFFWAIFLGIGAYLLFWLSQGHMPKF